MSQHRSLRERRPDLKFLLDVEDAKARETIKLRNLMFRNDTFDEARTDSNKQNANERHKSRLGVALARRGHSEKG